MLPKVLVFLAIGNQLATLVRAASLSRLTGKRMPWPLFMAAFLLMALAMAFRLAMLTAGHVPTDTVPGLELAMFLISSLFLAGVLLLPPSLRAMGRSESLEASLGALLDNSLHEVLVLDPESMRFILANRGIQEALGYSPEELKAMGPMDLDETLDPQRIREMITPLLSGETERFERITMQRRKDGSARPVEVHLRKGSFEGKPVILVLAVDITRRLEAEADAERSKRRLEEAQRIAHVATWEWDISNDTISWSEELFRIFGLEPGSFSPRFEQIVQVMAPECRDRMKAMVRAAIEKGEGFDAEYTVVQPSGERRTVHVWARMESGEDGKPARLIGVSQDITDLRAVEEALRASEARLRSVMENAPVILFGLDAEGRFTLSEGRGLVALGLEPGQVVGASVRDLYADQPDIIQDVERALAGEEVARIVFVQEMAFDTRYMPVRDPSGEVTGAIGVATDITEMVQAQDEQWKLAALVERSQDFIGLATLDGEVLYLNPAGMQLVGLSPQETLEQRNIRDFVARPQEITEVMDSLRQTGYWSAETELRNRSTGERIPVSTQTFLVTVPETGEPLAIATVMRDLREEKAALAERDRMETLLMQSQKMETIGTLAGGIAHDFNNLLTPILGWAQLIREDLGEDHPADQDLQEVVEAALRAKELVRQILSFSRHGEQERKPIDPCPVVEEAVRLLRATLPSSVEIRSHIRDTRGWIRADPTQIHQVVMNLGTNSLHAMKGQKGLLSVELTQVEVDEIFAQTRPALEPGPHIRLTVSDTGKGMDPSIVDRVLEPFFTTKEVGEGTGLGLSVVHGIVTSYGGDITLYSEPRQGTSVSVYIPVTEPATHATASGVAPGPPPTGTRVLFVDDQLEILALAKRMLTGLGYRVRVAPGGPEAVTMIRNAPEEVDVLITDFTMPGMDGLEVTQKVREVRQTLPVVLVSGFSEDLTSERLSGEGIGSYLMKPFVAQELDAAIRRVLEKRDEEG